MTDENKSSAADEDAAVKTKATKKSAATSNKTKEESSATKDKQEKKKKVIEKMQAMGLMPGGSGDTKNTDNAEHASF